MRMIPPQYALRRANGGGWKMQTKSFPIDAFHSHRESVRLGNSIYPSRPCQLGWYVGTGGFVRRKPIRGWPPALPLSLRRRSANFSNSIPVQDTRWLEFDGSWYHKQSERRDRSSRWHY